MASFFKNLFRKDGDSQPVPSAPLTNGVPDQGRLPVFQSVEPEGTPPRSAVAAGGANPFAAVGSPHLTARELASLLPPALLRFDGISPDQPVPLPVEPLRQSLQSGRPVLRLSQIQEACPMLFQRPLEPGEDLEVTLPMARVRDMMGSAATSTAGGPVAGGSKAPPVPAAVTHAAPEPPTLADAGNPFTHIPVPTLAPSHPSTAVSKDPSPFAALAKESPFAPAPVAGTVFTTISPFAAVPPAAQMAPASGTAGGPFAVASAPTPPLPSTVAPPASAFAPAAMDSSAPFPIPSSPLPASPTIAPGLPPAGQPPATFAQPVKEAGKAASPFTALATGSSPPVPFNAPLAASLPPGLPVTAFPGPPPGQSPSRTGTATPAAGVPALSPSPFAPLPVASPHFPAASAPDRPMPHTAVPVVTAQASAPPAALPAFPSFPPAGSSQAPLSWPPGGGSHLNGTPLPILPRNGEMPAALSEPTPEPPLPVAPQPLSLPASPHPGSAPFVPGAGASPVSSSLPPVLAPVAQTGNGAGLGEKPAAVSGSGAPGGFSGTSDTMELSLRAVLRDADPIQLGFAPENVPEAVRISLPVDLVSRQLATGRVEIGVDDIRAGISEKFRPAFARAVAGLRVAVPMSEVFHNLPESARPCLEPAAPAEGHMAITTSPFQTPFAIKAEEDSARQLLDLSVTAFDPATARPHPVTLPVPSAELPPAPLPPVVTLPNGVPPATHLELPVLRPVASAVPAALEPMDFPRPGMLSRPPGSGTAPTAPPTPPRTAPRLKSVPVSPTALRAFPKPAPPPAQPAHPPEQSHPLPPASSGIDSSDDLGESFSAARLGTEPPPRAGSVPVALPVHVSAPVAPAAAESAGLPPAFAEAGTFADLSAAFPFPAAAIPVATAAAATPELPTSPVPIAELSQAPAAAPSELPSWPNGSLTPSAPVAYAQPPALPAATSATASPFENIPEAIAETIPVPDSGEALFEEDAPVSLFDDAEPEARHEAGPAASSPESPAPEVPLPPAFALPPVITAPVLPAIPVPAARSTPAEDLTFGCISDIRQLTLRAVLGTDQALSPQDIVDRCAALPGLKACVLFRQDATLVSQGIAPAEAAAFHASAVKTRDSLTTLAETMGLGSGGNFTLRTDHGVRSFFMETGLCLAVWHDQPAFSGGTREKLILIARELAAS